MNPQGEAAEESELKMDLSSGQSVGWADSLVNALGVGEGKDGIGDEMRGVRDSHPLFGHWIRVCSSRSMPGGMVVDNWEMK